MKIPPYLTDQVRSGNIVLFLGAGASKGAKNEKGEDPPSGEELKRLLASKFLKGKFEDKPLHIVAELAVNETSLFDVQEFIAQIFRDLKPAEFHKLISTFFWRGIASTNYDQVLEQAYSDAEKPVQKLASIISDRDRIDEIIRSPNQVALLKLHGCISRTNDEKVPLILTVDQYITHKSGRGRLFTTLHEWGCEHPLLFIGHGIEDFDIRMIIHELDERGMYRPHYYLVTPSPQDEIIRYWTHRRIDVIEGTFEEFLLSLDSQIPSKFRTLLTTVSPTHPIDKKLAQVNKLSASCYETLKSEIEYVHPALASPAGSAKAFYKGFDLGWYPIQQKLDVRRHLTDTLLLEIMALPEEERPSPTELYVVKAEAGAGKSTFLRRLAWEATSDLDLVCLFVREHAQIRYETICEIHGATRQRIFLFVDSAADSVKELEALIMRAKKDRLLLTILTAERVNEWNMCCQVLNNYVTRYFLLPYLTKSEIETLLDLLQEHDSLGHLKGHSRTRQIEAFEKRAGRQLLVALHEATLGKPFEEIIADEYNEIRPKMAQSLYLTVCILNRLNVPVRAGLISRTHGIPFSQFKEKLFEPLEHVVRISGDERLGDYYYTARHPQIAAIVFERILTDAEDRFNEYARILSNMNLTYDTDNLALRRLIQGRVLLNLFPDHKAVLEIFKIVEKLAPDDAYIYQQKAIYEMHRPNPNFQTAYVHLKLAQSLNSRDPSIIHSLSELARLQSLHARSDLEKKKYRAEAKKLASSLLGDEESDVYARHTLMKILKEELSELLTNPQPSDHEIDQLVREIEGILERGLQEHPSESYLLTAESDVRQLLEQHERALQALKKAFESNRRDGFVAIRLVKQYRERGESEKASQVLVTALDANPADKQLNFAYAMLLIDTEVENHKSILFHLRRSYTKWDKNLEAQFLYGCFAYQSEDDQVRLEADEVFRHLRETPMAYEQRVEVKRVIREEGKEKVFTGVVVKKEDTYGFITVDGRGDQVFMHMNQVKQGSWDQLTVGKRCAFNVGFSFNGAQAINVESN